MAKRREDLELETKAIYHSVLGSIDKPIRSPKELEAMLQQSGRISSRSMVNKYWKPNTKQLTLNDVKDIFRAESVSTSVELMAAFKQMDLDGNGYIDKDEFLHSMTKRGERLKPEEVMQIIRKVDRNNDGRLDFREFCDLMMSNVDKAKQYVIDAYQKREDSKESSQKPRTQSRQNDSNTSSSKKSTPSKKGNESDESAISDVEYSPRGRSSLNKSVASSSSRKKSPPRGNRSSDDSDEIVIGNSRTSLRKTEEKSKGITYKKRFGGKANFKDPSNLKKWQHYCRRGCFFFEEMDASNSRSGDLPKWVVISHSYTLTFPTDTHVLIKMQPFTDLKMLDQTDAPDLGFILMKNNMITAVHELGSMDGMVYCRTDLSAGTYHLLPFTSGAKFKHIPNKSSKEMDRPKKLTKQSKDGEIQLTVAFKDALSDIFTMSDLDGNGRLSKEEFNLYNLRTCGETLSDELWTVVEENCKLERGEIVLEDFLHLNLLEAQEDHETAENLWITLESMGFNKQLFIDQALPFVVDVYTEAGQVQIKVVDFDLNQKAKIDSALMDYVIFKGEKLSFPGFPNCSVFAFYNEAMLLVAAEYKDKDKRSSMKITIDCSLSNNLVFPNAVKQKLEKTIQSGKRELLLHGVALDRQTQMDCLINIDKI